APGIHTSEARNSGPHRSCNAARSVVMDSALMPSACPGMAAMAIRITDDISLDEREIDESFIRSSGPGGQNVNKLSTAVQLRFDVRRSPALRHDVRERLERLAGRRLTREGVIIITAQRFRTQERNRQDARDRLFELIRQ